MNSSGSWPYPNPYPTPTTVYRPVQPSGNAEMGRNGLIPGEPVPPMER